MKQLLLIALTAMVLAACGQPGLDQGSDAARQPSPSGKGYIGEWTLVTGESPDGPIPMVEGYPLTLVLGDQEGSGNAACNSYGIEVTIEGSSFDATGGSMTEIGCEPRVAQSQDRFIDALLAVDTISVTGKGMILEGGGAALEFERVKPLRLSKLVDTRWELDTLLDGRGSDATASSVDGGHLVLSKDGRITGSTGCKSFKGTWIRQGEHIAVTRFGVRGKCSDTMIDQNAHVIDVLGDGFTVQIEGNRLTTYIIRGSRGLVFLDR